MTLPTRRAKKPIRLPKEHPLFECKIDVADVTAIKALSRGTADADQQKRAFDWILFEAARVKEVSYQPDSDRGTAFLEGRRYVGLRITRILTMSERNMTLLKLRQQVELEQEKERTDG